MRRFPTALLVSALGFSLVFGVALAVSSAAGATPAARLHQAALEYLEALYQGDGRAAAAWRAAAADETAVLRARAYRGALFVLEGLHLEAGEGQVTVIWLDRAGRPARLEVQHWREVRGRGWRFVGLDRVAGGLGG